MHTQIALSLMSLAFLGGCASKYVAPTSGPVANVTYVADANVLMAYVNIVGEDCSSTKSVGVIGSPEHTISLGPAPVTRQKKVVVAANALLTTQIDRDSGGGFVSASCRITTEFLPKPSTDYRVTWSQDVRSCRAQIDRLDLMTGAWVPEETAKRVGRRCIL
jgi:hypothetical protein